MEYNTGLEELSTVVKEEVQKAVNGGETTQCCASGTCS